MRLIIILVTGCASVHVGGALRLLWLKYAISQYETFTGVKILWLDNERKW